MATEQRGSTCTDASWLPILASGDNEDVLLNFTRGSHSLRYKETNWARDGHGGEREDTTGSIPGADVTEYVLFCDPVSAVRPPGGVNKPAVDSSCGETLLLCFPGAANAAPTFRDPLHRLFGDFLRQSEVCLNPPKVNRTSILIWSWAGEWVCSYSISVWITWPGARHRKC